MSPPEDAFALLARVLADAELPHALIGGHAVNAYLPPRFTADIDVTVSALPDALSRARAGFEAAGYRATTVHGAQLPSGPDFVRFSRGPTDAPVELQAAKTAYQNTVVARAKPGPSRLAVATAADIIVRQLIAPRPTDPGGPPGPVARRAVLASTTAPVAPRRARPPSRATVSGRARGGRGGPPHAQPAAGRRRSRLTLALKLRVETSSSLVS